MKKQKHLLVKAYVLLLLSLCTFAANAATYYWVGGKGNWSQIAHWATTSGGSIKMGIAPGAGDDVVFDANSGFTAGNNTVTLDVAGSCHNMTWNGAPANPQFATNGQSMNVTGSLQFQRDMTLPFAVCTWAFTSNNSGETIKTNGVAFSLYAPIIFNGNGGWKLLDSLILDGVAQRISLRKGTLNLNGQYIRTLAIQNDGATGAHTLDISNATIDLITDQWNDGPNFTFSGSNCTLINTGGSTVILNTLQETQNRSYTTLPSGGAITRLIVKGPAGVNINGGTFSSITLEASAYISNVTTDSLQVLTPGSILSIDYSKTLTVNKYLWVNAPACASMSTLSTSETTNYATATLAMGAGSTFNVGNVIVRSIKITGATPYAVSGIDQGGNTGLTFTSPVSHTYYWVGGKGNWSNPTSWATSSGGAGGSGCVPTPLDNIIFDNNSGFSTTGYDTLFQDAPAYCDSMSWKGTSGAPVVLYNPSGLALTISGSLELQAGMHIAGSNHNIIFNSSHAETIKTNGVLMGDWNTNLQTYQPSAAGTLTFKGTGSWKLLDSLKCPFTVVKLTRAANGSGGTLNFNGQYASVFGFSDDYWTSFAITNSTIEVGVNGLGSNGQSSTAANWWTGTGTLTGSAGSTIIAYGGFRPGGYSYATVIVPNPRAYYSDVQCSGNITKLIYLSTAGRYTTITADTVIFGTNASIAVNSLTVKKYLDANPVSTCASFVTLGGTSSPSTITMGSGSTAVFGNMQIGNIKITGAAVPYTVNGIDNGGNSGFTFTAPTGKTYYWVGGTGNWSDNMHWANISGGTPGSGCIPTLADNVIFDDGSGFTASSKTVTCDVISNCDSMTWKGSAVAPAFVMNAGLTVRGSLELQAGMSISGGGGGGMTFTASTNESIKTNGVALPVAVTFSGSGSWKFLDAFTNNTGSGTITYLYSGTLNFNGKSVNLGEFWVQGTAPKTVDMTNSTVVVSYRWGYGLSASSNLTVKATGSTITCGWAGNSGVIYSNPADVYNRVIMNCPTSNTAILYNCSSLSFRGSGNISTNLVTDTLILAVGNTYTITSGTTTTINKIWYGSGNPCFPSTITSSTAGSTASISMPLSTANLPNGVFGIDYVRMKDINAVTSDTNAQLQMGSHSTDNGNNTNWVVLPYSADGISGLRNDSNIACTGVYSPSYTLSVVKFYPSPGSTYLWDNGSTAPERVVNKNGTYWVKVNYGGSNCVVTDTVHLTLPTPPLTLPKQVQSIGPAELSALTTGSRSGTFSYWKDSLATDTLALTSIRTPSTYYVKLVDTAGCSQIKSITVDVQNYFRTIKTGLYTDTTLWQGSSDSTSWTSAFGIPDKRVTNIEIRNVIYDTRSSNATVPDFTVSATGEYHAPDLLSVYGNLENNGTFYTYDTIAFVNRSPKTISGTHTISFTNINMTDSSSVNVLRYEGVVGLISFGTNAILNTGNQLALISRTDRTAGVGTLPAGADVIGKVWYQRNIPGGKSHRKWRFLAMPIQGQTFANSWQNSIYITGPGTGGQDCGTTGNMVPNSGGFDQNQTGMNHPTDTALTSTIFSWDEQSNAWRGIPSTSTAIDPTIGYRAFIRGDRNQEGCALLTVMPDSVSPVTLMGLGEIVKGTITKNLTYTAGKGEGWNLLSNPYPCSVSWASLYNNNSANLDATISILNPIDGRYAYYSGLAGTGTNGGSDQIGSGQSFFVQAYDNTSFNFTEQDKSYNPTAGLFGKAAPSLLKIRLAGPDMEDEAVIVQWSDATYLFDKKIDTKKSFAYAFGNTVTAAPEYPTGIATGTTPANKPLVFNFIPFTQQADTLPLFVKMKENISYTFSFPELTINETYHLWLHDKYTNSYTDIRKHNSTKINTLSDAASYSDNRFELLIINSTNTNDTLVTTGINEAIQQTQSRIVVYPVPAYDVLNVQLNNASSGTVTVGIYDITGKEVLTNDFNLGQSNETVALSLNNMAPGAYFIRAIVNGQPLPAQKFIKN